MEQFPIEPGSDVYEADHKAGHQTAWTTIEWHSRYVGGQGAHSDLRLSSTARISVGCWPLLSAGMFL
jgi:hypothetical protein